MGGCGITVYRLTCEEPVMSGIYIKGFQIKPGIQTIDVGLDADVDIIALADGEIYDVIPVPDHGRLIDADALTAFCTEMQSIEWNNKAAPYSWAYAYESFEGDVDDAPTVIPAEKEGET